MHESDIKVNMVIRTDLSAMCPREHRGEGCRATTLTEVEACFMTVRLFLHWVCLSASPQTPMVLAVANLAQKPHRNLYNYNLDIDCNLFLSFAMPCRL